LPSPSSNHGLPFFHYDWVPDTFTSFCVVERSFPFHICVQKLFFSFALGEIPPTFFFRCIFRPGGSLSLYEFRTFFRCELQAVLFFSTYFFDDSPVSRISLFFFFFFWVAVHVASPLVLRGSSMFSLPPVTVLESFFTGARGTTLLSYEDPFSDSPFFFSFPFRGGFPSFLQLYPLCGFMSPSLCRGAPLFPSDGPLFFGLVLFDSARRTPGSLF